MKFSLTTKTSIDNICNDCSEKYDGLLKRSLFKTIHHMTDNHSSCNVLMLLTKKDEPTSFIVSNITTSDETP